MKVQCGSPALSKKHHLFKDGDAISICGGWMYAGEQYDIDLTKFGTQKDDCKGCAKKYAKALEREAAA